MHLKPGEIRSYQDGEVSQAERQRVETHLAACASCREQAGQQASQARRVIARLDSLQPAQATHPLPLRTARHRLERRIETETQENQTMLNKLFNRISRPAWIAITLAVVLVVALAFPSVRAVAGDFLSLFRVEQVRVVPVDMNNLSNRMEASPNLETVFSDNVKFDKAGEPQEVADAAAASAQSGLALRLPASLGKPDKLMVQPGGKMSLTINLALMQGVMKDMGLEYKDLPASLDGKVVTVEVPASVAAIYGDCADLGEHTGGPAPEGERGNRMPAEMSNCTTVLQMPSPQINAPDELDVNRLGQVYLQLLGMAPDEAAQFASSVDWTTTFVVPVPRYNTQQKEVEVNGVTGTLIRYREGPTQAYALIWVKDGIVYAISGPGDGQTAVTNAASMQ